MALIFGCKRNSNSAPAITTPCFTAQKVASDAAKQIPTSCMAMITTGVLFRTVTLTNAPESPMTTSYECHIV